IFIQRCHWPVCSNIVLPDSERLFRPLEYLYSSLVADVWGLFSQHNLLQSGKFYSMVSIHARYIRLLYGYSSFAHTYSTLATEPRVRSIILATKFKRRQITIFNLCPLYTRRNWAVHLL